METLGAVSTLPDILPTMVQSVSETDEREKEKGRQKRDRLPRYVSGFIIIADQWLDLKVNIWGRVLST